MRLLGQNLSLLFGPLFLSCLREKTRKEEANTMKEDIRRRCQSSQSKQAKKRGLVQINPTNIFTPGVARAGKASARLAQGEP
jgi:hypothetical protein